MRQHGVVAVGVVAAILVGAGSASGAVSGVEWRSVNNSVSPWSGAAPGSDPVAGGLWASRFWQTWDLYVVGGAGDVILGISDAVISPGPDAVIFNHPSGGDTRTFALEAIFSAMSFDTYVALGGTATQNGAPLTVQPGIDLSGAIGGRLFFSFLAESPTALGPNGLRVLRVSAANFDFLRYDIGIITPSGIVRYVLPSPGPSAFACLVAGSLGARRRR